MFVEGINTMHQQPSLDDHKLNKSNEPSSSFSFLHLLKKLKLYFVSPDESSKAIIKDADDVIEVVFVDAKDNPSSKYEGKWIDFCGFYELVKGGKARFLKILLEKVTSIELIVENESWFLFLDILI